MSTSDSLHCCWSFIKISTILFIFNCLGVSTSGMPNKHPGRVGDSALPGNGLYAGKSGQYNFKMVDFNTYKNVWCIYLTCNDNLGLDITHNS